MHYSGGDLARRFSPLDDAHLLDRLHGDASTEEARALLCEEITRRGLLVPEQEDARPASAPEGLGNLQVLTRAFDPTEACLLRGLPESEGIPAFVADANLVQANQFLTAAVGFVRVLVPESRMQDARLLLERFRAGEFALPEDMEIDDVEPEGG